MKLLYLVLGLVRACSANLYQLDEEVPPTCPSEIYCHGKLLETVQLGQIFGDSKTFVDMDMRYSAEKILSNFDRVFAWFRGRIPRDTLKMFIKEHFINCEQAENCPNLEPWEPPDWKPNPPILNKIMDPAYKEWATALNALWKSLSRKMNESVLTNENMTSLIYVPNGFIVPGGRFREIYYWDTFWIVKGLLICDMKDTARGMIENLLYLIRKIGHIPNGNRVYYLRRTQPPMLMHMVETYVKFTDDWGFISENLETLESEMEFFLTERMVVIEKNDKKYHLFRYYSHSSGPRPESYKEDIAHAQRKPTEPKKVKFFMNIKSAAESGWGFSSRWFMTNGTNQGTLDSLATTHIIPADLNALLHRSLVLLMEWNYRLGLPARSVYYKKLSNDLLDAIENVLWNEDDGIWYDYDAVNNRSRAYFYLSNFVPLWTGSFRKTRREISLRILEYINTQNIFKFRGGTPVSYEFTNEAWDYPNAWPPLQAFLIQALDRGNFETMLAAFNLANRWVASNYLGFKTYGKMFEMYNALEKGKKGSGGEYELQEGFGWTNGVIFDFFNRWGNVLTDAPNTGENLPVVINE